METSEGAASWLCERFQGKSFHFAGKFEKGVDYLAKQVLPKCGASIREELAADVTYVVLGLRGVATVQKTVAKLAKQGAKIESLSEEALLQLLLPTRDQSLQVIRQGEAQLSVWNRIIACLRAIGQRHDLTKADLKGAEIKGADFQCCQLDGSDFSGARLSNVYFGSISGLTFDGATMAQCNFTVQGPCSFRNTQLNQVGLAGAVAGCDFSGARFSGPRSYLKAPKGRFVGADFSQCSLSGADFREADLTDARLDGVDLSHSQLAGAILCRAHLVGARLFKSDLTKAELTQTDLRNADLVGANLSAARLEGTDFTGAHLVCANLTGADTSRAKGIEPEPMCGPFLKALEEAGKKSLPRLSFILEADAAQINIVVTHRDMNWSAAKLPSLSCPTTGIAQGVLTVARRWKGACPRLESLALQAYSSGQPLEAELPALAIKALCESFGQPIPAEDVLSRLVQPQDAFRARLVAEELKGGAAGVQKWNSRPRAEILRCGSFRGSRLEKADLCGVRLIQLDFQEAVFDEAKLDGVTFDTSDLSQASLKGAQLQQASLAKVKAAQADFSRACLCKSKLREAECAGANFEAADLAGIDAYCADLHKARFIKANLKAAYLESCDLRGCNLTGACLEQANLGKAKYDAKTVFPEGMKPPLEMQWAGSGPNPFFDTTRKPDTLQKIDFDTFMKGLPESTEHLARYNALKMLKSTRYQLFSEISAQELVGVVRSQSDKELVYSCRLTDSGDFACCTQNLKVCGGLRGKICKHILVLVVGLTKAGKLAPEHANLWIANSRRQRPILDKDRMAATFVRYKSAEAGELDWRPTETVPEDYLGL